jgi:hypothetical protein
MVPLNEDDFRDGLALNRALHDNEDLLPALVAIAKRMNDDAIAKWTAAESRDGENPYSKKWLRGYREAAADFVPNIQQRIQDAVSELESRQDERRLLKSRAEDGIGSGDLAIA